MGGRTLSHRRTMVPLEQATDATGRQSPGRRAIALVRTARCSCRSAPVSDKNPLSDTRDEPKRAGTWGARRSFTRTCVAASSRTDFRGFDVTVVATISLSHFRARRAASAPAAVVGACRVARRTSWIAWFRTCRCASSCSRSHTSCEGSRPSSKTCSPWPRATARVPSAMASRGLRRGSCQLNHGCWSRRPVRAALVFSPPFVDARSIRSSGRTSAADLSGGAPIEDVAKAVADGKSMRIRCYEDSNQLLSIESTT